MTKTSNTKYTVTTWIRSTELQFAQQNSLRKFERYESLQVWTAQINDMRGMIIASLTTNEMDVHYAKGKDFRQNRMCYLECLNNRICETYKSSHIHILAKNSPVTVGALVIPNLFCRNRCWGWGSRSSLRCLPLKKSSEVSYYSTITSTEKDSETYFKTEKKRVEVSSDLNGSD